MTGIAVPKVVVVTGAGSGIGRATAVRYARGGAAVAVVDVDEQGAKQTVEACGPTAALYVVDVSDARAVRALATAVHADLGPVEVLVNNAGVGLAGDFLDCTDQDWEWIRGVNLDGVVNGCRAFGPPMVARRAGQVVNISSGYGYVPSRRTPYYCATKAAVLMLTASVRADWRRHGVGVSAACPGVIQTPIQHTSRLRGLTDREYARVLRIFSHGHPPEAVAAAVQPASSTNKAVVPVGIEAHVGYYLVRVLPPAARDLLASA